MKSGCLIGKIRTGAEHHMTDGALRPQSPQYQSFLTGETRSWHTDIASRGRTGSSNPASDQLARDAEIVSSAPNDAVRWRSLRRLTS